MSKEIANPVTFYSLYGYLEVDRNEFESDKMMVGFIKPGRNMYGTLNVIQHNLENRVDE
jgi:hypothetical protein